MRRHGQAPDDRQQGFSARNNKTKRRFLPNLHTQRFWLEGEKRFVRLRMSRQLRIIDKRGIEAVVKDLRAKAHASKGLVEDGVNDDARENRLICRHRPLLHDHEEPPCRPEKMEVTKYDPRVRKHVIYKETKIK